MKVLFTGFEAGDELEIEGINTTLHVPPTGVLGPTLQPKETTVVARRNGRELFRPTRFDFRETTEINLQKVLAEGGRTPPPPIAAAARVGAVPSRA